MDFQIEEIARIPIRGFNLEEILFDINFTNVDRTFGEAWLLVENMIEDLVQKLRIKMNVSDMISLNFFHSMFYMPVSIPFIKKRIFTKELVLEYLLFILQSYKENLINTNNSLNVRAQIQKIPVGAGRKAIPNHLKKNTYQKLNQFLNNQKSKNKKHVENF